MKKKGVMFEEISNDESKKIFGGKQKQTTIVYENGSFVIKTIYI